MKAPSTLSLGIAVLIAVSVLAGASWSMGIVARPADYRTRMASVEAALDEIERDTTPQQPAGLAAESLCKGPAMGAAQTLRDGLVRIAGTRELTLKEVSVTAGPAKGRLAGLDVSLVAEGGYEGVTAFVGDLQTNSPEVFVDATSLTQLSNGMQLKIRGRAFCWTSDRR